MIRIPDKTTMKAPLFSIFATLLSLGTLSRCFIVGGAWVGKYSGSPHRITNERMLSSSKRCLVLRRAENGETTAQSSDGLGADDVALASKSRSATPFDGIYEKTRLEVRKLRLEAEMEELLLEKERLTASLV
jgi:hypothetical protein